MDKSRMILIAVVVLVILLAGIVLYSNITGDNDNIITGIANNTTELLNDTNISEISKFVDNQTSDSNSSANNTTANKTVENVTSASSGWKWSEQANKYVNEYVDSDGNLHVKSTDGTGPVDDLEYKANGTVYLNGKDVTSEYNKDFK